MITLNINNETDALEAVVLGLSDEFGGIPKIEDCYDPKSREHVKNGTFPTQQSVSKELDEVLKVLLKYQIKVYRPQNIKGLNQIFTRDIGFVIENKFLIPNIISDRQDEVSAIDYLRKEMNPEDVIDIPSGIRIEGGDVMLSNEYIFLGYSQDEDFKKYQVARTNTQAIDYIQSLFPHKKVKAFELQKSDINPRKNALHLDCCFQPVGSHYAILYQEGFKNNKDVEFLCSYYGHENIIFINQEEMYHMNSNVFSISPKVVLSEKNFVRLNKELRNKGLTVEEVSYSEIAKMEGLLRCSTLPLQRK